MRIRVFTVKRVKRLDEIEADDVFEAFMHASAAHRMATDPLDRERIHIYVDQILDKYLEFQRV